MSLSLQRPPDLDDAQMIDLLREAATRAMWVTIDAMPTGLIVEAEAASLDSLQ